MMSFGPDLLSAKASFVWIAALSAVLVFHCTHLIRMHGERRCYHSAHVTMLGGMLYMYATLAFDLGWPERPGWIILYSATSAGIGVIIVWISLGRRQRRSRLWLLALVQQASMIYMWAPMEDWIPALSWGLVLYFTLEAAGWLIVACQKLGPGAALGVAGSSAHAIAPDSALSDLCQSTMAGSMAYMFAGMQLMMSTPR